MKKLSIILNFTIIPLLILILTTVYSTFFSLINIAILAIYGLFLIIGKVIDKFYKFNYYLVCKFKVWFFSICLLIIFLLPLILNINSDILVIGYSLWPLVLISIVGIILNYLDYKKQ